MIPGLLLLAAGLLLTWEAWQHAFPPSPGGHRYRGKTYDGKPTIWAGEIEMVAKRVNWMHRGLYKYATGQDRVMRRA